MSANYYTPFDVTEVLSLLKNNSDCKIIAGGTDLMVHYKNNITRPGTLIDISQVSELKNILLCSDELVTGACVTLFELIQNSEIQKKIPLLITAAKAVASPVIRLKATIAGNLLCENRCEFFNQSEWWRNSIGNCLKCEGDVCIATGGKKNCFSKASSDLAPALIALDAYLTLISPEKSQPYTIPLYKVYSGNGITPHILKPNELITSIHIPIKPRSNFFYYKLRQRESIDFSSLTMACCISDNLIKIAIGSVDPSPLYWTYPLNNQESFEDWLKQKIKKVRLVDNDFFSREYRKNMLEYQLIKYYKSL